MNSATATTTPTPRRHRKRDPELFKMSDFNNITKRRKLVTFNSNGAIYFPKLIREIFKGYYFTIEVSGGKIILDPIKIEDDWGVMNHDK